MAASPTKLHSAPLLHRHAALRHAVRSVCQGLRRSLLAIGLLGVLPGAALAQNGPAAPAAPATTRPQTVDLLPGMQDLKGRRIEDVIIRGNAQVPTAIILNQVRSRPGQEFDPAAVAEDYQRVFNLKKFANVEARAEATPTGGVNVVLVVTEQRQIRAIRYRGAVGVTENTLRGVVDVREGDAIDGFRISLARNAIESYYHEQNYSLAHVTVDDDALSRDGVLLFNIVEGPEVRVRNIRFVGAKSYTDDKLSGQIKSGSYIFIFNPGRYIPDQIEEDVAALRKFYESKGYFDARIGRKIIWSPDLSEVQIDFLIDEGPRYKVDKVTFQRVSGDTVAPAASLGVSEAELRSKLKLLEGISYDNDAMQRDVREIVRVYSGKFGYIYFPGSDDPDYLRVETKNVFRREPGKVEVVYRIHEGKEFRLGNIYIKGNSKSQDKLAIREFRDLVPGERFNSALMQDATERVRRRPFFQNVSVTPIGNDPNVRDLLVEVNEQRTAQFNVGAGVNSNGGLLGNLTFEQRNFDIGNPPPNLGELFSDRSFTGAGQNFKASFEPGTVFSGAYVRFSEPFLFDQNVGFTNEAYLRTRIRENYDDRRLGDQVGFDFRYDYNLSFGLSLRGENVKIHSIEDEKNRPQEILDGKGKSTLTSVGLQARYETIDYGLFPTRGTVTTLKWENVGALGGDHAFNRYTLGFEAYHTLHEDLLDRKTVVSFRGGTGYIAGSAPYFERFYGGGIGSMRGFQFRGISPRSGPEFDPIGGEFYFNGTVEVGFPITGDNIRGVVFTDFGTVEPDVRFGNVRMAVGAGVRVLLPFLGQAPLAIDLAFPLRKETEDETQVISFSFGFIQ